MRRILTHVTLALTLTALTAAALGGCMRPQPSPTERLHKALHAYHGHLVFKRFDQAAGYVPVAMREDFLSYYEDQPDFHITEYDMDRLEVSGDEHRARAIVSMRWYALPSTKVEQTRMEETWEFDEDRSLWEVVEQKPFETGDDSDETHEDAAKEARAR